VRHLRGRQAAQESPALDRLNQLAPEAGPFGADADVVAEVLDQVQVGKVTLSWSAAGTVAESPDQDRLHRLVEAGVLRSSKEPALHPGRRLISCSGHPICPEGALGRWANGADQRVER
jgi:hypothetical protein